MANAEKIYIIGIGENGLDGLTSGAKELILGADLLVGEDHALALVPESKAERLVVGADINEAIEQIAANGGKRAAVVAIGDPLFYGVARYLCDKLGKDRFEVVPHVSSMQLAFARVKESWEESFLTNLANHDLQGVLDQVRSAEKVGLFTSDQFPPAVVAEALLDEGIDYFSAYICENLGSPDERVTQCELSEVADQQFDPLNVMILVRKPNVPDRPSDSIGRRLFGNPDEAFRQSKPQRGLLTPWEIRSMALAEMDIGPSSVIWDIGAGSGSVSIEAAQIASEGTVYAIEMDPEDYELLQLNVEAFGVSNVVTVLGRAPEAWADLPEPDCIFVGGSGRGSSNLVAAAYERLRVGGRLAATMADIDNLHATHQLLHPKCQNTKVLMVNVARGNCQLERLRFESMNPTFLVSVVKG